MSKEYQFDNLPPVEGVDWEYAFSRMKDPVLIRETAENFVKMSVREKDELEACFAAVAQVCDAEMFKQYRIRVHSMKNSAAMIGATSVSDYAKELEYAAGDEDIEKIQKQHAGFLSEWAALTERLREHFGQKKRQEDLLDLDFSAVTECLKNLNAAMEDFDLDASDEIIRRLSQYNYNEKEEAVFAELEAAVQNLDSAVTADCIRQMENLLSEHHE